MKILLHSIALIMIGIPLIEAAEQNVSINSVAIAHGASYREAVRHYLSQGASSVDGDSAWLISALTYQKNHPTEFEKLSHLADLETKSSLAKADVELNDTYLLRFQTVHIFERRRQADLSCATLTLHLLRYYDFSDSQRVASIAAIPSLIEPKLLLNSSLQSQMLDLFESFWKDADDVERVGVVYAVSSFGCPKAAGLLIKWLSESHSLYADTLLNALDIWLLPENRQTVLANFPSLYGDLLKAYHSSRREPKHEMKIIQMLVKIPGNDLQISILKSEVEKEDIYDLYDAAELFDGRPRLFSKLSNGNKQRFALLSDNIKQNINQLKDMARGGEPTSILLVMLQDDRDLVRIQIPNVFESFRDWKLSPQQENDIETIAISALKDRENILNQWAVNVLKQTHDSKGIASKVKDLLKYRNPRTRQYVSELLGGFGRNAECALGLLGDATIDECENVRKAAKAAEKEIQNDLKPAPSEDEKKKTF